MEPVNKPTYRNGTSKDTLPTDMNQQTDFGMTSSHQDGVVPILHQTTDTDRPTALSSATQSSPSSTAMKRASTNRTTFPVDKLSASAQLFWYVIHRRLLFGIPIVRLIISGLMFMSSILLLRMLLFGGNPLSNWIGAFLCTLGALYVVIAANLGARRDFVHFSEETSPPTVASESLDPKEKLPVHATGRFSVESKQTRLTWAPGFYRTFATREHAIMCFVQADQFEKHGFWARIGQWNPEELGMWYSFLTPDAIFEIRRGQLDFGDDSEPALAIEYTVDVPASNFIQRLFVGDRTLSDTLYLVCESSTICDRIYADLQHDFPL